MNKEAIQKSLSRLGVKPQKSKGQNFLASPHLAEEIVAFAALDYTKPVLEIGPGLGVLSAILSQRKEDICLVELETAFCNYLKREYPAANTVQADILSLEVKNIFDQSVQIISNLPYSISSEVLFWALEQRNYISSLTLLLQKEFAQRVAASPGNKIYGILSVQIQAFADVELGLCIPGSAFYPEAEVESQVLKLEILEKPRYQIKDEKRFKKVVRASFATRRKTIENNLKREGYGNLSSAFESVGIDPRRRAETLSVQEFVELSNFLEELEFGA